MTSANDNQPRRADGFASLHDRRRWLEFTKDQPEPRVRPVKACPTATRLLRAKRVDDLVLLQVWQEAHEPPRIAGNDNERRRDARGEVVRQSIDTTDEIRPTINELYRAWKRVSVSRGRQGDKLSDTIERSHTADQQHVVRHHADGSTYFRVGDLEFDGSGRLTKWHDGETWQVAQTSYKLARGSASGLIDPDHVPGEVPRAEDEVIRVVDAKALRQRLGAHANVLDMAASDSTAREIGETFGRRGKSAERRGAAAVDEALVALRAA